MAGVTVQLDKASAIVATRIKYLTGRSGHSAVKLYADVTAITRTTGSMVVGLLLDLSGTLVVIASRSGIIVAGLYEIPVSVLWEDTRFAIPEPALVTWSLIGDATAVTGTLHAIYGD